GHLPGGGPGALPLRPPPPPRPSGASPPSPRVGWRGGWRCWPPSPPGAAATPGARSRAAPGCSPPARAAGPAPSPPPPPRRPRAPEARGDVRPVRARADARAACRAARGGPDLDARTRNAGAPARRDRVPEGGRRSAVHAGRRGVLAGAPAAELVRAHVGPHERRGALVSSRPDAEREALARAGRAARRVRADAAARSAAGADPVLAGDRAVRARAWRASPRRRVGVARRAGRERRVARERDPLE